MMTEDTTNVLASFGHQVSMLLYCRTCLDVRLMSPSDATPHYSIQGENLEEESDQEQKLFLQRHSGHSLAPLKKKKERFYADRPVWDPFRTAYEEVFDGRETFLLKSWRSSLEAPRQYALLRGILESTTTVSLPPEPLRDALACCFPYTDEKLNRVVQSLQRAVAHLPSDELIPAYCAADDPHLSFAYLRDTHLRVLVRCCNDAGLFPESKKLWEFFVSQQQEEALTLEL